MRDISLNIDKLNQYILGDNFTTQQPSEIPSDTEISLFFKPEDLFQENMTEEEFVDIYQKIISGSFSTDNDIADNLFSASPFSDNELSDIEEIAKRYFKSVDTDGDGVISEEEINFLASKDGDATFISDDDIKTLTKELFSEQPESVEPPVTETPEITETKPKTPPQSHNSGGDGGSYNPVNNDTNNLNSEKSQTLEEIQKQRSQKQTELDSARSALKTLYSDGNKNVNDAKEKYNEAVQNDNSINAELKAEQKQNADDISVKEKEIGSLKSELVGVKSNISNYNSVITAKDSEIAALNSALSNLNSSDSEDAKAKKAEVQSKLAQAEADKKDAQTKLNEATAKEKELESSINVKEKELAELTNKKAEIDNQILNTCSDVTKTALTEFKDAQTQANEAVKKAEDNIEVLQKEINKLDEQINAKQSSNIQTEYNPTKLNKKYTLNGKEYLSLLSQDELNNFLSTEWKNGNYNYNSNCLAMSNKYCSDLMRMLNLSGGQHDFINDSKEAVEQKAKESLDRGYPVTLHVSTQRGTRHFATAVGYRINDNGKIEFLLADNVRGVGISSCGDDGARRHLITGYSTPYANQNYGYRCMYYG